MSSPETKRPMQSCWPCHLSKVSCSKTRPTCKRCSETGRLCWWQGEPRPTTLSAPVGPPTPRPVLVPKRPSSPPTTRQQVAEKAEAELPPSKRLRPRETASPAPKKVARRKSTSKPPATPAPQPPVAAPPTSPALPSPQLPRPTWNDGWDLSGGEGEVSVTVAAESAIGYCTARTTRADPLEGRAAIQAPFLSLKVSAIPSAELALPSDASQLAETYLEHVNPRFPLFAAPALRQLVSDAACKDARFAPELQALVLLICANATRYLKLDPRGPGLYSTAAHLLCLAPPSPTKSRADVLRCIYLQETNQIHEAWSALSSAIASVHLLGAPIAAGPLFHHLTRLELLHAFLAGRRATMPPPPPFAPSYPILSSTTSFQIASYAFTSLLLDDQPHNLRSWAPPIAASSSANAEINGKPASQKEQRKGNAIGREGQLYYIALVRMVLLVRVGSFVAPRNEAEIQASLVDAKELLDAAAEMSEGETSGLVTLGAFIAILVYTIYSLRSGTEPSKEMLNLAEKFFSTRSAAEDPLAGKGLQVLQMLKEKSETVALLGSVSPPENPPRALAPPPPAPTTIGELVRSVPRDKGSVSTSFPPPFATTNAEVPVASTSAA